MSHTLALIGLGNAGAAMCQALIAKGVTGIGHDPNAARTATD